VRDWLRHLWFWLRSFPREHAWTSVVGEPEETCLMCGKKAVKPQEEMDWDLEMLEKHPEWKDAEIDKPQGL